MVDENFLCGLSFGLRKSQCHFGAGGVAVRNIKIIGYLGDTVPSFPLPWCNWQQGPCTVHDVVGSTPRSCNPGGERGAKETCVERHNRE